MKYLKLIEEKIDVSKEKEKISMDIDSTPLIADGIYNAMQKYCDQIFSTWMNDLNNETADAGIKGFLFEKIYYDTSQKHLQSNDIFMLPGIYLWGIDADYDSIPRYVGKTEKSFRNRLFNRYIPRKTDSACKNPTQCALYEILRTYPDSDLNDFYQNYANDKKRIKSRLEYDNKIKIQSFERLWGAIDFARFKNGKLWFAILPFETKERIDIFETLFIRSAQKYNSEKKYDNLVNKGKNI